MSSKDVIESLEKLVSIMAIVVGGAWAYWRFGVTREAEWNLEVTVAGTVLPYGSHADKKILVVVAKLANVGKTVFVPSDDGITLKLSRLNKDGYSEGLVIDDELAALGEEISMLRYYNEYYIEPGCTYEEVEAVFVPADTIVSAIVTAHGQGTSVDGEAIITT